MRYRLVAVLLVLPAMAAGLTGCRPAGAGGILSGQTIEVFAVWSGGEQRAFGKVLDLFERQTGADVTYVSDGDDLSTLIQTRVNGGNPPNVAISPNPGVIRQLATSGALKPLDLAVAELVNDNYAPFWKDLGAVQGKLYAVPYKANNNSIFWYNDRILTENGLVAPNNWDEFIALSTDLADLGISPVAVGGADGLVLTDWFENVYLQLNGPRLYDMLSRHEIPWTDPSVRRALEKLKEFFGQEMFIDGGRARALQTMCEGSFFDLFGPRAKAAMMYESDSLASIVKENTPAKVGEDAKFFPFPRVADDAVGVVVGGDAAVAFKDDRATTEFMKFLASPQAGAMGRAWRLPVTQQTDAARHLPRQHQQGDGQAHD